jgi:predicted ATPase
VLVGRNGTGKSNVLEALTIIFRDLDLGEATLFKYELEYECRGQHVFVDSDPDRPGADSIRILVGDTEYTRQRFSRKYGGGDYLPNNVFVYYSGQSDRMLSHFGKHERLFDEELRAGRDQPLRPLLYVRLVHSKFALLSFFWKDGGAGAEQHFLRRYLRIEDLDTVLFVLKRPYWYSKTRQTEGDTRFWGAKGVVRDLLDQLWDLSLAPMRSTQRGSKGQRYDRLYLFLRDKKDLQNFATPYETGKEFFKALDSMHVADLVEDVRARVKVMSVDGSLTFRELSEGEQQLLMVLGLLRFTLEEESVILLDEPDTHLNPAWGLEYVHLLEQAVPNKWASHIIMATHDPLVVAGLQANQVHVMRRVKGDKIEANHPEKDPIGMGISGLLTSDVYGLRSELDPVTMEKLDLRRRLAIKKRPTASEQSLLAELNQWLRDKDFTREDRDPLYKQFVEAMTAAEQEEHLQTPLLTPAQKQRQKDLAFKIARELKEAEAKQS